MTVSEKAKPYFAEMLDDLLAFWDTEGKHLGDTALFIAVSLKLGKRMLTEVCPMLDLELGECSVGAILVVKEAAERAAEKKQGKP